MKKIIPIFLLALLSFCISNKDPVSPFVESDFAFYFLRDKNLKMKDVYNKDPDDLKLAIIPWLTDRDIRFYDWSSHCIYLKKDKSHFFPFWENGSVNIFPPEWADKPFVVTVNGKKCYMGYFFSGFFSNLWIAPTICDVYNSPYPSDILFINWLWLYHDYPQNHPAVKQSLIHAGIFRGGITVAFDTADVNTLRMIENADTSTISYQFTVTNTDIDDLYVPDPDKMGSGLFHRFTNGPDFMNLETRTLYESRWKKDFPGMPYNYWLPDWYTKLKSGESMQRTVVLKGYPHFPPGEYMFQFLYTRPKINMEKENRELADGRYWIGPARSDALVWRYSETDDPQNKISSVRIYGNESRIMEEKLRLRSVAQQSGMKKEVMFMLE